MVTIKCQIPELTGAVAVYTCGFVCALIDKFHSANFLVSAEGADNVVHNSRWFFPFWITPTDFTEFFSDSKLYIEENYIVRS